MDNLVKENKNLITYALITLLVISIFGINFFISFIGNILLLLFLIPLLFFLALFVSFNYTKSKINTCNNCGAISLELNDTCMNCGAKLDDNNEVSQLYKNPSGRTIEVKAEEVK